MCGAARARRSSSREKREPRAHSAIACARRPVSGAAVTAALALQPECLRLEPGGVEHRIGTGPLGLGGFELSVELHPGRICWSIRNSGSEPRRVRSIALVQSLGRPGEALRMLRHGLQSWSVVDVATFGLARDPSWQSTLPDAFHAAHNADERPVHQANEIRSEGVTVLRRGEAQPLLIGFASGTRHDGTIRLRETAGGIELVVEAFLGEITLAPGAAIALHDVVHASGASTHELLLEWASTVGRNSRARTNAGFVTGWCSWYHYFADVTEADVRANLARAPDWPLDVFQIDDGYQRTIGDWLHPGERFQSPIAQLASEIHAAGLRPGIWLAPFLVAPDSTVARDHPEWLAHDADGNPLIGMINPIWGGGLGGLMLTLDTTRPEVEDHLAATARALVGMGYSYLKLDFTFAPRLPGVYADAARTPAERVRAGYDAIRRGAGDEPFLLGCGAPLLPCVGVVDAMRIGADVAPAWDVDGLGPDNPGPLPGYARTQPATRNALVQTVLRSFMHRRLWLNDPDCLMLRRTVTRLADDQIRAWSAIVARSGGLCVLSDDLALLGERERAEFDALLVEARASDAAARAGHPAEAIGVWAGTDHPGLLAPGATGATRRTRVDLMRGALV